MNLDLTPDQQTFLEEVRAFVAASLPAEIKRKVENCAGLEKQDYVTWQKILFEKGWIAPNWPKQHGGCEWDAVTRYLFEEELTKAACPRVIPFGLSMLAQVLLEFGTEAQKERFLPPILSSDEWWCQGYSESGSGSDLASLKTRAVLDGDHYVVNGAKTWTTMAHYADWIFCLVRTDEAGKPQQGITFLLIDMTSDGVSHSPIKTIDGGVDINDVFLDEVRVPVENRIGEEGQGWTIAKYLLGHERAGIAGVGQSKQQLARLKEIAALEGLDGDQRISDKITDVEIDLMALEYTTLRVLSEEMAGKPPSAAASLLKIKGTEVQQVLSELLMETVAYFALPYMPDAQTAGWNEEPVGADYAFSLAPHYFNWRKSSIYGGTNEIQKNIIAKMVLGV